MQYDFGESLQGLGLVGAKFLNAPPTAISTAVAKLQSRRLLDGYKISQIWSELEK